jgi:hypothetical protein
MGEGGGRKGRGRRGREEGEGEGGKRGKGGGREEGEGRRRGREERRPSSWINLCFDTWTVHDGAAILWQEAMCLAGYSVLPTMARSQVPMQGPYHTTRGILCNFH